VGEERYMESRGWYGHSRSESVEVSHGWRYAPLLAVVHTTRITRRHLAVTAFL
jgi:hypothetical protein